MLKDISHIIVVAVAFLATLACFTVLALNGGAENAANVLRDVLLGLGGVLGGVAMPRISNGK